MALKKKFVDVEIPILQETMQVLGDNETLPGRTIKLDLSRKLRGRGLEAVFNIMLKDGKLVAYPKNLTLMRSYIQRMMRKRISYVEDSFTVQIKDVKVTIKPFLITRKKVSRAIRNNLRRTSRETILEYIKDKTFMDLATDVLGNNLQKEMHPKLKKVYPLSLCEIRVLETTELVKADLTIRESKKEIIAKAEAKAELTQAEEIELELKEKAKKQAETEQTSQVEEKKEKKAKKSAPKEYPQEGKKENLSSKE